MGFTIKLAFAIFAAAFGSAFQHGYNTGVLNNAQTAIEGWIKDTIATRNGGTEPDQHEITLLWSITVSIYCIAGMIGGISTGWMADKFGRKGAILVNNVFVVFGVLCEVAAKPAKSYELIMVGRFLLGINSGLNGGLAPMYLSEIAPVNLRGAIGTVYQLIITISILISQVLGSQKVMGNDTLWPYLLGVALLPAAFQMITMPCCPESPRYLLLKQRKERQAKTALIWLRGTPQVRDEIDEMKNEYEALKLLPKVTFHEMLSNRALRIPLIISLVIMIAQQVSGINAVIFYSNKIFGTAGLNEDHAEYATIGIGIVNVLMTIISLFLVEKAGRKTLLLVGFIGCTIGTLGLTVALALTHIGTWVSYACIGLVFFFIIMFAIGPGSIPWFLVTELFNQAARPLAASLAVSTNWVFNFLVGLCFLPLQEVMGPYVFLIFTGLLVIIDLFIIKKVPETKNKTIEEISAMFRQQSYG